MPYTEEDEEHLIQWLAIRMPHKEDGGRAGNLEWQQLCERAKVRRIFFLLSHSLIDFSVHTKQTYGENEWAKRHPWQSWRDHYKHKQEKFDPKIDKLVRLYPPSADRHGLAPVKRSVKRMRAMARVSDDDGEAFELSDRDAEEDGEEAEEEEDRGSGDNRKRRRTGASS